MSRIKYLACDTETTGLDFKSGARPFFVSTCTEDGTVRYWRFQVDPFTRGVEPPAESIREIREHLAGYTLVFHNSKFDLKALCSIGIDVRDQPFEDTLLASHAVSSSDKHGLKGLAVKYFGYTDSDEKRLEQQVIRACNKARKLGWSLGYNHKKDPNDTSKGRETSWDYWIPGQINPNDKSCEEYACNDVERTILLWSVYKDLLDEIGVRSGYEEEKRLVNVIYKTEEDGFSIDLSKLDPTNEWLMKEKEKCGIRCNYISQKQFGYTLNLASTPDLIKILHSKKGWNLEPVKLTKTGAISTDKDCLNELYEDQPEDSPASRFLYNLLFYRSYKSASGYLENYRKLCKPKEGYDSKKWAVIYPNLNQTGTRTTRFSSSNPNGQNICVVKDTEILTEKGWIKAQDLNQTHKVAQYWPLSKSIDFVIPSELHSPEFNGDVVRIKTELHIDFCVTPDHRCLIENRKTGELKVVRAEDVPEDYKLPQAGTYIGGSIELSQQELVLLCAVQADGSYRENAGISLRFRKKRKIRRLRKCLQELGANYSEGQEENTTRFYIKQNCRYNSFCKEWLPNKQFNEKFLTLCRDNIDFICDEIFLWDGDSTRKAVYSSSDKGNSDWVQILQSLSGRRSQLMTRTPRSKWSKREHHYVNISHKRDYSGTTNRIIEKIPYRDKVYCVTVPSEFFIIRYNGIVSVTGNCKKGEFKVGQEKFVIPKLRDVFSPPPGKIWYAIDYSQLELRLFAGLSNDKKLLAAFESGEDVFCYMASLVFGRPIKDIDPLGLERQAMKNTTYATIYGASKDKINKTAGMNNAYELFRDEFADAANFMDIVVDSVRSNGHIRTACGYRLDAPRYEAYKGLNYKIQGTAGRIAKRAMQNINDLKWFDWKTTRMVIQIHDEIIIETDIDGLHHTPKHIYDIMDAMVNAGRSVNINTPVTCSRVSTDWGHGEKIEVTPTEFLAA